LGGQAETKVSGDPVESRPSYPVGAVLERRFDVVTVR
jgi:hypothetical protein